MKPATLIDCQKSIIDVGVEVEIIIIIIIIIIYSGIKRYKYTEVTANRPDIIIKMEKEKTCIMVDLAMLVDRNVVQKKQKRD